MKRKVILIGSASFSGSTLLDVMIGNGPGSFACGEIYAFFRPWHPHHENPTCTCGDRSCDIWPEAKMQGPGRLYSYLFTRLGVQVISDSSKDLGWFDQQTRGADSSYYRVETLLIYKHPADYLWSRMKRQQALNLTPWYNYYSDFLARFQSPSVIVAYSDLARQPATMLERICKSLEVPYFPGKERFWEGESHHLFGASSVRIHFAAREKPKFEELARGLKARRGGAGLPSVENHQTIYFNEEWKERLPKKFRVIPPHVARLLGRLKEKGLRLG